MVVEVVEELKDEEEEVVQRRRSSSFTDYGADQSQLSFIKAFEAWAESR